MKFSRNQVIGLFLLILGMPVLIWGNWAVTRGELIKISFSPSELGISKHSEADDQILEPSQGREVILVGPAFLRLGDEGRLSLTLMPSGEEEGNGNDIYTTHNLVAAARVEMEGVMLSPAGETLSPMQPGMPLVFNWQVRSLSPGIKEGTLWLHLEFIPLQEQAGDSARQRILLAAPRFPIKVVSFLGLAGLPSRVIGGLLVSIGIVLLLEPRLSAIISNLFKKENSSEEPRKK